MAFHRINEFFNNKRVRKTFLKLRYPIFLVLLVLLLTQLKPLWFIPGLIVSILGELLQVWCFSTIQTQKQLTQVGPYMFVRNPMYIGRFFLIFGILMMTGNIWILIAFTVLYYFYMANRVRREEKKLEALFGQSYKTYCQTVNRYIPGFKNIQPQKLLAVSSESFFQNNAHWNILLVLICYIILFCATFVWPIHII
ncbi:MAG TPA: isoprenylcysteine carboxylmethyltransferase family protein [Desulfosalsimonadaceae bacterium]|nr:isoprenylcysteine carboxylmethyltransferase family protein [Desulfosalsimonadaceae bacterium]